MESWGYSPRSPGPVAPLQTARFLEVSKIYREGASWSDGAGPCDGRVLRWWKVRARRVKSQNRPRLASRSGVREAMNLVSLARDNGNFLELGFRLGPTTELRLGPHRRQPPLPSELVLARTHRPNLARWPWPKKTHPSFHRHGGMDEPCSERPLPRPHSWPSIGRGCSQSAIGRTRSAATAAECL